MRNFLIEYAWTIYIMLSNLLRLKAAGDNDLP
jgi:hypothetical protein